MFALPPVLRSRTGGPPASVTTQIGVVVVVEIADQERPRLLQRGRHVRGNGLRRILEAALHVSQHGNRRAALRVRARGDDVQPAVVVIVDHRKARTVRDPCRRQIDVLERGARHIPPERQSRRGAMREDQVHPAVLVEIDNGDAAGVRGR